MIKVVEKYGRVVSADIEMDKLRRKRCLCMNCNKIMDCEDAERLFGVCKRRDIALMVTRCPNFVAREEVNES